jgi:hypothetical protein
MQYAADTEHNYYTATLKSASNMFKIIVQLLHCDEILHGKHLNFVTIYEVG